MTAWKTLEDATDRKIWAKFELKFQFRPSVDKKNWPGIREPKDSATFSIGHVYSTDEDRYVQLTNDLGQKLIIAFRKCVEVGTSTFVLDWQHQSYCFTPHEKFNFDSEDDWPVPALPNGDYYIFLSQDLSFGVFGHPWEQTMCVFGQNLIEAFEENPPILFDQKIRVGGMSV